MIAATKSRFSVPEQVSRKLDPPSLGKQIDKMNDLREAKRKLEAEVKNIEDKYTIVHDEVMATLEKDGMAKATGTRASVSISMSDVANVTDWQLAEAYMKKNGYLHLFQRRLNDAAVRELWTAGKTIPGVEPFTKKRLNLRAVT